MTRLRGREGPQHLCCFRGKISLFQKEGAQGNLLLPGREAAPNPRRTEGGELRKEQQAQGLHGRATQTGSRCGSYLGAASTVGPTMARGIFLKEADTALILPRSRM